MPVTPDQVAGAAETYIGKWTYVFGGTPNPPRVLVGDCSSFASMILGYRCKMVLPGGIWGDSGHPPNEHGPNVAAYIGWAGAETVQGAPQRGDLVCYGPNEHIGIATDSQNFVSALNPDLGVRIEPIAGGASGSLVIRRIIPAVLDGGKPPGLISQIVTDLTSPLKQLSHYVLIPVLAAGGVLAGSLLIGAASLLGLVLVGGFAFRQWQGA